MKPKVLIVDDSALTRRNLRQILEAHDYDVVEAEDGLSAIERYYVEKPAVVLLDLVMRGMYGLEVIEKLRELDTEARIVVVSAAIRIALGRRMVAPWIMVDELIYSELAKSFAEHGRFLVRGETSTGYGFVYPLLIAPAWRLFHAVPELSKDCVYSAL